MNFFNVRISEQSIHLVNQVLRSGWIGEGPMAAEFECQLAERMGLINPVTVNSGTAALHLALVIAGIRTGDEVIVPPQTFVATAMVVQQCGAIPVFADIDPQTGNISAADLLTRITNRTKAIIPVHYGGLPCDMAEIGAVAKAYKLTVIEDAAHALGATYREKPIGSISRFTCFSFQAVKQLTCGDGGALCCLDRVDAAEAFRRRWFGIDRMNSKTSPLGDRSYDISEVGYKYHLNDVASAIGLGNLSGYDKRLKLRQQIGDFYRQKLQTVQDLELLRVEDDRSHAYYLFTILVENRSDFIRALADRGVPASVSMLRIDKNAVFGGQRSDLPGMDYFDAHQVSIPIHEDLTLEDLSLIVEAIRRGW